MNKELKSIFGDLTSIMIEEIIHRLKKYKQLPEFNYQPRAVRRGVNRCIHLYHIASALRMIETGDYEDPTVVYQRIKTEEDD